MPTPPKPLTSWQQTLPEELPRHIRRNIGPADSGCWRWTRSLDRDGYGWASLNNKTYLAHRIIYILLRGEPAPGLQLDHLCHTNDSNCPGGRSCIHRRCVNPDHLEPVTVRENLRRGHTTTGMTECALGHPLSQYHNQRRCLICLADYNDRKKAARRARSLSKRSVSAERGDQLFADPAYLAGRAIESLMVVGGAL
jgi:hypothetical protein